MMIRTASVKHWRRISIALIFVISVSGLTTVKAGEPPLIFPIPQSSELSAEKFILDSNVAIILPLNATAKDASLARLLTSELSDKYGLILSIEKRNDIPANRKVIVMGALSNPLVKKYCSDNKLALTAKDPGTEGYVLNTSARVVVIGGSDDAGAYYGYQSLRQLIAAGNGTAIQGIKVKDWPNLPVRAIRLYVPGPENMAFFKRFMKNFMSLYKFNKVVMEFNCMRLDRHPEVNTGWEAFEKYMKYTRSTETLGIRGETKNSTHYDAGDGAIIEKEAVRDIVKYANDNFIEVIPEIPSLSHSYYLLANHPELAEYPNDKWPDTYCTSNPDSYKLLFDVYDEYIDVIKPKMVHIGHDEWRGAPIGVCPRCKGKDYSEIYANDVVKIHSYLASKGIKTAMWGDFLVEKVRGVGPQEHVSATGHKYLLPGALPPALVKKTIPKDILLFNWFWDGKDNVNDKGLSDMGFTQFYGNLEPVIQNWDQRVSSLKIAGGGPSSWTATNEYTFGKDLILDYLGCANLLWSKHTLKPEDLTEIGWALVPSIRSGMSAERLPGDDGNVVEPVDISSFLNFSKDAKDLKIDLSNIKSGQVHSGSKVFNLPKGDGGKIAVAVGSQGTGDNFLPREVNGITINEDVSSLIFLQSCALPSGNQRSYFNVPNTFDTPDLLGWYEIVYEDGFKAIVPIQYGLNVLEWNVGDKSYRAKRNETTGSSQGNYCYRADALDCSANPQVNPVTSFAFEWVNPRFGKVVKQVNFHGSVNYQALQPEFEEPITKPMPGNAVLLLAISKVKKQDRVKPI